MRKKVLFIGMLVTLLFAFSGCGTKNLQSSLRKEQTEKLS